MIHFLAMQSTYECIEIGLFENTTCRTVEYIPKTKASATLIEQIDRILIHHNQTIQSIAFLAINRGPGPFTTLRVLIATVNGFSFAHNIPLVGIDGLNAFLYEYTNPAYPITVVLLNAFNNDVYFAIQEHAHISTGYKNIDVLLYELTQQFTSTPIRFLGNGTALYREKINTLFKSAYIPEQLPATCSVHAIGLLGIQQWEQRINIFDQLQPLYLKQYSAHIRQNVQ